MNELKVTYRKTADLIPYVNNARTHSDDQVTQIAASIREFGFNNPILLDGANGVIAGHGRLLAAKKLGLEQVPCVELSHLSGAQKKAYILADNKLALNSSWDDDLLKLELDNLQTEGIDLDLTGFSEQELNSLLDGDVESYEEPEDTSGELDLDDFDDDRFKHKCPKCGFQFND